MQRILIVFIFISSVFKSNGQIDLIKQYNATDLHPPMKIDMVLSGNFGELRSNHFHTGIDIKTNGQEGFNMYAILDGHVSRIKISPWGYGKAIYIDHPNGLTTVYAHCSKFPKKIEDFIEKAQYQLEKSAVDLYPGAQELPIKKGEVIAFSGNSGSSHGPHLHFEIRDTQTENPLNPLLFGFDIKDNIQPDVQGIYLYSLSSEGYEKELPENYYNAAGGNGKFTIQNNETILLSPDFFDEKGQLGIGLHAIDRLNGAGNKCGIYDVKVYQNGQLIHHQNMHRLSFMTNRFINAHMDPYAYHELRKNIQKQFISPLNMLPIYSDTLNGRIELNGKVNQFKIEVQDAYGNTSFLNFKVELPKTGTLKKYPLSEDDFINPRENTQIETEDYYIQIPYGTIYEPMQKNLKYILEDGVPLLTIGEEEPPVHQYYIIAFKIPEEWSAWKDKILITQDKGRYFGSEGGYVNDDFIETRTRSFGTFSIALDTSAPAIDGYDIDENTLLRKGGVYRVKVNDNLSGTDDVDLYINNQWIPLNYLPKRRYYVFEVPEKIIPKEQNTLTIRARDNKNNISSQTFNISL